MNRKKTENESVSKEQEPMKLQRGKTLIIALITLVFIFICTTGYYSNKATTLSGQQSTEQDNLAELTQSNTDLQKQISDYEEQISTLSLEKDDLEQQLSEAQTALDSAEDQQSTIDSLNEKVADFETQISELQADNDALKAKGSSPSTSTYNNAGTSNDTATTTSYTVYITDTGSKYHRDGCRYLKQSKIAIDKDSAIAQGYGACSVCNP